MGAQICAPTNDTAGLLNITQSHAQRQTRRGLLLLLLAKLHGIAVAVMLADPDPKNMMGKLPVASGAQMVPGSGSTYVEAGGHYYLKVDSYGDWTITVVQLP